MSTAAPTPPVVEALDSAVPSAPPPVAVPDAATHAPTPIAPQVPLPPLRIGGIQDSANPPGPQPVGTPTGEPVKPANPAPPGGTDVKPGTPPSVNKPTGPTGTTLTPQVTPPPKVNPPPAAGTELPRPVLPPTPTIDPAPTITPPAPTPTPQPAETKEKSADELMKDAQAAYVRGERGRAMDLALQVAEGGGPEAERAWRFIGSAACSVRNALMANRAYSQLASGEHKQMLLELCQRNGLSFQNGQFGVPQRGE